MSRILPDLTANVVHLSAAPTQRKRRYKTEDFVRLREEGETLDGIAKALGCSLATVRARLTEAGLLPIRKKREKRSHVARHGSHIVADKPATLLPVSHPALSELRTVYPATVTRPGDHPNCLINGQNNRKIGGRVHKGTLKGLPIFTLTLEERKTCPTTCRHWRSCYGNSMHMAKRFEAGTELEHWLPLEIEMLLRANPKGIVVRLHILGDFYSVEYVELWRSLLEKHPNLYVFGFTARTDKGCQICAAIARMVADHWPRFAMRFSNCAEVDMSTVSIEHPLQKPENAVICPAQTGQSEDCGSCALCWSTTRPIAFLQH